MHLIRNMSLILDRGGSMNVLAQVNAKSLWQSAVHHDTKCRQVFASVTVKELKL